MTQCGHAFCMHHKDDQKFKDSTCPGCQAHLSSKGGMRKAVYAPRAEQDWNILNGLTVENSLKIVKQSIEFWCASVAERVSRSSVRSQRTSRKHCSHRRRAVIVTQGLAGARKDAVHDAPTA